MSSYYEIQEKLNPGKLCDQLEIRHPQLPDRMMNLHIDDAQNVKVKATPVRQNIDPLMENDETEIIHTLNIGQAEHIINEILPPDHQRPLPLGLAQE